MHPRLAASIRVSLLDALDRFEDVVVAVGLSIELSLISNQSPRKAQPAEVLQVDRENLRRHLLAEKAWFRI